MRPIVKRAYEQVDDFYQDVFNRLQVIGESLRSEADMKELADTALAMREAFKLINALRTRLRAIQEQAEKQACAIAIKMEDMDKILTEYTRATVDMKMIARIPSRKNDTPEFQALMKYLEVPRDLWDETTEDGVMRVHWPGIIQLISQRVEQGKPLPEGLDVKSMRPLFRLSPLVKRKSIRE